MLTKLGTWVMSPVPDAVLERDSQVILNILTAIFIVGILAIIKSFLTMQLRVPGLKQRYGFPLFRSTEDMAYLSHLYTKTEKAKLVQSPEYKHMVNLRGGTENTEQWNW